jgi:hypothetical protein
MRNPFLPDDKQPVMVCRTCNHFERRKRADGYEETLFGGCSLMKYSSMPHSSTCAMWTKRKRTKKEEE